MAHIHMTSLIQAMLMDVADVPGVTMMPRAPACVGSLLPMGTTLKMLPVDIALLSADNSCDLTQEAAITELCVLPLWSFLFLCKHSVYLRFPTGK